MTTVRLKTTKTTAGQHCYVAWIQHVDESGQYATRTGALRNLCERLANQIVELKRRSFVATAPCECDGWGTALGCPGCGNKDMSG